MKRETQQLIQTVLWVYIAVSIAYFCMLLYQLEWKALPEQESTIPKLDESGLLKIDALLRARIPLSVGIDYSTPSASLGKAEPFTK